MIFKPMILAINPFTQMFFYYVTQTIFQYKYSFRNEKETFVYSDGGRCVLTWFNEHDKEKTRPIIVLIPGLCGDDNAIYMMSCIKAGLDNNFDCVLLNHRGAGVSLSSLKMYSCGASTDMEEAINYIHKKHCEKTNRKIFCVGISLGSGIISKYLEKFGTESKVSAAFCLNSHFNAFKAMGYLRVNKYGIWDLILGTIFKSDTREMMYQFDEIAKKACPERQIREEFDRMRNLSVDVCNIIVKAHGYSSLEEYFEDTSFDGDMHKIKVPVFYLNAEDDPIFGTGVIPYDKAQGNVLIATTRYGAHTAYITDSLFSPRQFFTDPAFEFFNFMAKTQ
mmetsp:Transcript_116/g.131  ORF Transcript_116/g.131 Transcript_116/m.131 type:complete len:335 (+) Transcript_116:218-1222(+)